MYICYLCSQENVLTHRNTSISWYLRKKSLFRMIRIIITKQMASS